MLFYDMVESLSIKHIKDLTLVCHLHGWSIGIAVTGYDILSCPFCSNDKLFAQFT